MKIRFLTSLENDGLQKIDDVRRIDYHNKLSTEFKIYIYGFGDNKIVDNPVIRFRIYYFHKGQPRSFKEVGRFSSFRRLNHVVCQLHLMKDVSVKVFHSFTSILLKCIHKSKTSGFGRNTFSIN